MSIFREKKDKLNLSVSNSDNPVKLKVDCQYGTVVKVSFGFDEPTAIGCGKEIIIGSANGLKGKSMIFVGTSGNPGGGKIKIIHTIFEENGNKLIYAFPDDYTGDPKFDQEDEEPTYEFNVNFL